MYILHLDLLRQGSTDKTLGLENAVLCPDSVNRLGLGVDPRSFAVFKGHKVGLDGLKDLFLGVKLGFGDSVCFFGLVLGNTNGKRNENDPLSYFPPSK